MGGAHVNIDQSALTIVFDMPLSFFAFLSFEIQQLKRISYITIMMLHCLYINNLAINMLYHRQFELNGWR